MQATLFDTGCAPRRRSLTVDAFTVNEPTVHRSMRHGGHIADYARERLPVVAQECFAVLTLNQRNEPLGLYVVTVGTLNASLVHPREVFRHAIMDGAAAVAFVHNHPSGNPEPSAQDRELTDRMTGCCRLLGFRLLDHVIIAPGRVCSFAERGLL